MCLRGKKKSPDVKMVTCIHRVTSRVSRNVSGISGDVCSSGKIIHKNNWGKIPLHRL